MKNLIVLISIGFWNIAIQAATIQWDNGAANNDWNTAVNWAGDAVPAAADTADVSLVGANKAVYSSGTSANYNAVWLGVSGNGEMDITGGTLNADASSSQATRIGLNNGYTGTLHQSGGTVKLNALQIGVNTTSSGFYYLSGGDLRITRTIGVLSLAVGVSGSGFFEASGGSLMTRSGVSLGGKGTFSVVGTGTTAINIGSVGTASGFWTQAAGSTLKIGIDSTATGITPIFIDYVDGTGTGGNDVTFASGALLDVGFTGSFTNAGTFTVMTWEAGATVIDNGLAFASGVDTNVWSFEFVDTDATNGIDSLCVKAKIRQGLSLVVIH